MKNILVVGGAGYIGSHMVWLLGQHGVNVVTLDSLSAGHRDAVLHGELVVGDVADPEVLFEELEAQAAEVAERLHGHHSMGRTVVLKLRYGDFTTLTRSHTCARPVEAAGEIAAVARLLVQRTEFPARAVRLVGVGVSGLMDRSRPLQLELFEEP